ncbi:YlbG family protein [Ligilactobacillus acidipiscis]|uniref:UPF0298 protein K8V00_09605 n=3 Tax=Ligilactobacillus acidipiscis TaxID=89059 RepID=A0A1K1KPJ9_9LACO|nr:YlbG family protein [Ligilactobacillus acidipiscis]MCI1925220.1 YlbG family protein [Ligilactobacillus acidipiscis]MCI1953831.1 YlbG family protein [Ligilactobacillus acidipiscis]WEV55962.1 YlbG family protein [Ligilactobacillus acidipiscis]SFV40767.1 hypothetical Cytosolic Protein [Ligilactobacillus acidipiscis]GAW63250.1 hypothetical protein Lacidipiscis_00432 [Ligilactobacillus acidipiscis]
MPFEIKQRQSIVVYLYHLKQSKILRKYGTIQYVSRKMKYVVLYLDQDKVAETMEKVAKLKFVKAVVKSPRPEIKRDFQNGEIYKMTEEDQDKNN